MASAVAARAKERFEALQAEGGRGDLDGGEDGRLKDFSDLELKPDHANRPLWACPDGSIFLEARSALYGPAYDFLVAIAEPVARPEHVHEYRLTPYSLYAAVSVDIAPASICDVLDKLSKVKLPARIRAYVMD